MTQFVLLYFFYKVMRPICLSSKYGQVIKNYHNDYAQIPNMFENDEHKLTWMNDGLKMGTFCSDNLICGRQL